jgi:hypothetical protein
MDQYRQLTDQMKNLLYTSTRIDRAAVKPLADEYHQACTEVNQRLRAAGDMLRRGLRSEALHAADVEPKLLEAATVLDFPELPQWLDLLVQLQLPRSPTLLIEVASELNDAYDDQKPLEELLRKHRLLAVGRAPLAARIAVLRTLAKRDSRSAHWRKDLQEYETLRFGELRAQVDRACSEKDVERASQLKAELVSSPWAARPPAELLSHVENRVGQLLREAASQRLAPLAERLESAMNDLDIEQAEKLLGVWEQLVAHARPSSADPLVARGELVKAWVTGQQAARQEHEEQQFARVQLDRQLEEFKAALKGKVPLKTLVTRREELRQRGVELPRAVEGQYEARLKQFRLRKLAAIALVAGLTVVLLLAAGGVIWALAS